ncbi:MAG: 30S ribosomal protein S6 [Fimbriiglobus sp.]
MPTQLYETLFILDPTRFAQEGEVLKGQLHTTLERYGSQILVSRVWSDNQKLAYPIRKQKRAVFYIIYYKVESTKQREIERDFAINENVMRQMTSNIDPKWANTMLDIAQNDNSAMFALRGLQDEAAGDNVTPNLGDGFGEGEAFAAAGAGRRRGPRENFDKGD